MASTASAVGENRIAASFTPREVEVLFLCARGFSDREIAAELSISVFTVGSHMRRVLRKSGSASRTEAVARAYEA
ncbi:MAG: response regulator transcription factor, partial [Spirochaetaceae bacterium]